MIAARAIYYSAPSKVADDFDTVQLVDFMFPLPPLSHLPFIFLDAILTQIT